jgi:chromate transport protein ChrA
MRHHYMVWTGHFLAAVLMTFGLWWLVKHISGLPDFKLVLALAAITGLVLNHLRWNGLGRKVKDPEVLEKITFLCVANYLVMLLVLVLVDF